MISSSVWARGRLHAVLGLVAWLSAACGAEDGPRPVGDLWPPDSAPVGPAPWRVAPLPLASDLPLPPRHFVELAPDVVLAADPHAPVIWRLDLDASGAALRPEHTISPDPEASILGMAAVPEGLAVLEPNGKLTLWDPGSWTALASLSVRTGAGQQPIQLVGLEDGGIVVLYRELVPGGRGGVPPLRHVLRRFSFRWGAPRTLWVDTPSDPVRGIFDQPAISAVGDTVLLSGELPPRLLYIPTDSPALARAAPLGETPVRRLSREEKRELEKEIRRSPRQLRLEAWIPELHPAVVRAWKDQTGVLAWAGAAGGVALLDRYCGGTYRGTVLGRRGWRELGVLPTLVIAVTDDPGGDGMRLEAWRRDRLPPTCPEDRPDVGSRESGGPT